jgi:hypothetical protein
MPVAIAYLPSDISRADMLLGNAPVRAIATASTPLFAAAKRVDVRLVGARALRLGHLDKEAATS